MRLDVARQRMKTGPREGWMFDAELQHLSQDEMEATNKKAKASK